MSHGFCRVILTPGSESQIKAKTRVDAPALSAYSFSFMHATRFSAGFSYRYWFESSGAGVPCVPA